MLVIPTALVQAIADYLTRQPYRDVAGLLADLQRLQPAQPTPQKMTPAGEE